MSASRELSTRRNLPHWRREGAIYWVTFRLADSLPQSKLRDLDLEKAAWLLRNPEPRTREQSLEYQDLFGERVQMWLDAGYGSCVFSRPDVRIHLQDCLLRFDGDRLKLHSAVIMPNHVHALMEPLGGEQTGMSVSRAEGGGQTGLSVSRAEGGGQTGMSVSLSALSKLLKGIKGASARLVNRHLGRTGTFWMDESYEHIVRSEQEYEHFGEYIRTNPSKARLSVGRYWLYDGNT